MLEKDIQRQILKWLNSQNNIYAVKIAQGAYSQAGISDILACVAGRFVAIEVKRKGGKVTALQRAFINKINSVGGYAFVAYSLDEVKQKIKELI